MGQELENDPSTKLVRFARGENLFTEGSQTREMYILRSGRVRVSISKDGREVPITELGKGCHVGEMSFIAAIPRTATVTALEPVLASRVSPDVLVDDTLSVSGWAISIARVLVERIKRTTELLGDYIATGPHPVSAESAHAHSDEKAAFSIVEGAEEGVLKLRGVFDKERVSPVKDSLRKAFLKRPEKVTLDFSGIIDIDVAALSYLVQIAKSSQAKAGRLQLRNMQLIRNKIAGMKEIKNLIESSRLPSRRVESGEYLIRQGERERSMFVISSGEFEILEEHEDGEAIQLGKAQSGDVVGEMSLLREGERSASVRAAKASSVIEITPKDFYSNLYSVPDWFMRILDGLVMRLRNTNEMLAQVTGKEREEPAGNGMENPIGIELDGAVPGVFALSGTITLANMEFLAPIIRHLLYSGQKDITIKLQKVQRIDRESIRYLMNLYMVLKDNGGQLHIQGNQKDLLWLKEKGGDESLAGKDGE